MLEFSFMFFSGVVPVQAGAVLIQKRRKKKRAEWGYSAA